MAVLFTNLSEHMPSDPRLARYMLLNYCTYCTLTYKKLVVAEVKKRPVRQFTTCTYLKKTIKFCHTPYTFRVKGHSTKIFDPQFFSAFEPAQATDQWVKIFSNLVSFSPRYSYFS